MQREKLYGQEADINYEDTIIAEFICTDIICAGIGYENFSDAGVGCTGFICADFSSCAAAFVAAFDDL